jgi:hypothetical protein
MFPPPACGPKKLTPPSNLRYLDNTLITTDRYAYFSCPLIYTSNAEWLRCTVGIDTQARDAD